MANNQLLPVCCFSDRDILLLDDARRELLHTICCFYLEAIDRLPISEYPNLVDCLSTAGHCYGLLEPVSNIILHAIAHGGPSHQGPYKREDVTAEFLDRIRKSWYWLPTANRSLEGLTTFLMSSHRYLTCDQAVRYLYLAEADVCVAMALVEREFGGRECSLEEELLPEFDGDAWILTAKASIMYAALAAEHPNPHLLVSLATETFGADHADKLAAWLQADQMDTVAVDGMYDSLLYGSAPDGHYLYSRLRASYPNAAATDNLYTDTSCIHRCTSPLNLNKDQRDLPPCDYIKRIEALLVDYIHALHLSVISRLSPASVTVLHRGLVVAGYFYGPLENPVFNILLNAIWYQVYNFPAATAGGYDDDHMPPPIAAETMMISTDLMLRNGFNALTGQVTFLCSKYGMPSGHEALKYLYSARCNLRVASELAEEDGHHAVSSGDFLSATEAAVKAMRHPKQDAMMSLMDSFTPELEAKLCDLLPGKGQELSIEAIHNISWLLSSHVTFPMIKTPQPAATTMHPRPLEKIAHQRRAFVRKHRFLMEKVSSLMDAENYKVHTIVAVARDGIRRQKLYHVNFLATKTDVTDSGQDNRQVLFFAQLFLGGDSQQTCGEKRSVYPNNLERSFCCPVTISAFFGRCFMCEFRRAKIIHPLCVGMEYYGRQETTYLNFKNYVAYFHTSINTELSKEVNEWVEKEELMTEEEAYEFLLNLGCLDPGTLARVTSNI